MPTAAVGGRGVKAAALQKRGAHKGARTAGEGGHRYQSLCSTARVRKSRRSWQCCRGRDKIQQQGSTASLSAQQVVGPPFEMMGPRPGTGGAAVLPYQRPCVLYFTFFNYFTSECKNYAKYILFKYVPTMCPQDSRFINILYILHRILYVWVFPLEMHTHHSL